MNDNDKQVENLKLELCAAEEDFDIACKRITQIEHELENTKEERDFFKEQLDVWFNRKKLAEDEISDAVSKAASSYLRRSQTGGMPSEEANKVQAVIDQMAYMGVFAEVFIRYKHGE